MTPNKPFDAETAQQYQGRLITELNVAVYSYFILLHDEQELVNELNSEPDAFTSYALSGVRCQIEKVVDRVGTLVLDNLRSGVGHLDLEVNPEWVYDSFKNAMGSGIQPLIRNLYAKSKAALEEDPESSYLKGQTDTLSYIVALLGDED